MAKEKKYTTDGSCEVYCGKTLIAQAYLGVNNGEYEVRILQGMPRMETWKKIFKDCPEFAKANNMDINTVPKLFAPKKKKPAGYYDKLFAKIKFV